MSKCLGEVIEKDGFKIFSMVPNDRARARGANETQEIPLKHKKTVISVRMVKHWPRFPGEVVDSLSLEIFKTQ